MLAVRGGDAQTVPEIWDTQAPLDLTIEANLRQIRMEDRQPGAPLRYGSVSVGADPRRVPAFIRTRGNLRLQRSVCRFPPLRIRIATDSIDDRSVPNELRGLGNARLVSPCRNGQDDLVRLEYLAYRVYLALSDQGYAVRPLRLTFVDSSGRDETRTVFAFLLEGDGHLAARLGIQPLDDDVGGMIDPRLLEPRSLALMEAFQYMIGNTDWSIEARHNVLVARDGNTRYIAIPYDFDFTGLVDAPYAAPDPRFSIKSVTERLYRGTCRSESEVRHALERVLSKRDSILAEVDSVSDLSSTRKRRAGRYLESFFAEASRGRTLRTFRETCRRPAPPGTR